MIDERVELADACRRLLDAGVEPVQVRAMAEAVLAIRRLVRSAYRRGPVEDRLADDRYKKGWELRLVVRSEVDADRVKDLVRQLGVSPGRAFPKSRSFVVPVYGAEPARFIEWALDLQED
jgi:hypothetical protein